MSTVKTTAPARGATTVLAAVAILSLLTGCASSSSAERGAQSEPAESETESTEEVDWGESTGGGGETDSSEAAAAESSSDGEESGSEERDSTQNRDENEESAGEASEQPAKADGSSGSGQQRPQSKTADDSSTPPRSPKSEDSATDQIDRAVEQARAGNGSDAVDALERLADSSDGGHLAAYNLGIVHEMAGDREAAVGAYEEALSKNPEFSPALLNLVRLYLRDGRVGPANTVADEYIRKRPGKLDHRAAKLEVLLAQNQYENVVRRAKEILRQDEKNVEAMILMARANYRLERYELAKAILERARELASERAEIYYLFGLIAEEQDDRERAIEDYERAVEERPQFPEARNALGLLYQQAGDYAAAAEQFERALATYPEFEQALLNLGTARRAQGQFQKAEGAFKRVLELDGGYADAYFNLGVLYLDNELSGIEKIPRLEEAIEYFQKYKREATHVGKDDPVDDYMSAAREKIKAEKQRQRMMRKMQKSGASGSSQGDSSGSGADTSGSEAGEGSGSEEKSGDREDSSTEQTATE